MVLVSGLVLPTVPSLVLDTSRYGITGTHYISQVHNVCNYKRGQNSYFIHESLPTDLNDDDLQTKLLMILLKLEVLTKSTNRIFKWLYNKTNTRGAIESDLVPVISGVSQNTALAPLMFVLYISSNISSDIHIYSCTSTFITYICCSWKAF